MALQPAEAMRPPAPVQGKRVLLERIGIIWKRLTVQQMMAVRNMSRNKGRSFFIFLGMMVCFAISSFTWSMNDMIQKMMYDQYEKVEVYDVKLSLARPMEEKKCGQGTGCLSGGEPRRSHGGDSGHFKTQVA